jgi:hypothetical protein
MPNGPSLSGPPISTEHETRREFSGVPISLLLTVVVVIALLGIWIGSWGASVITVGLPVIVLAAVIAWGAVTRDRMPATDAPQVAQINGPSHRILLVADERSRGSDLASELQSHSDGRSVSVFVMTPPLPSRLGYLADDQGGYDDAAARLTSTLDGLRDAGLLVNGQISASDPIQAADDGLRLFPADEIVFLTHADGETNWLEKGVVGLAESRYGVPVRHLLAR